MVAVAMLEIKCAERELHEKIESKSEVESWEDDEEEEEELTRMAFIVQGSGPGTDTAVPVGFGRTLAAQQR